MDKNTRKYLKGEVIFREGDEGDCAYLIDSGSVLTYLESDGNEVPLRVMGPGDVFGEMSLLDAKPRSASCRAVTDCHLLVVSKHLLFDRIKSADPVIRLLVQVFLQRLRSQTDLVRSQKADGESVAVPDSLSAEKNVALERLSLEHRIHAALDADEFLPFYQPIYDLKTGDLIGCEALMRWKTKDGNVIMPGVFMDSMEESYLILRGGRMMIEKSLRDLPKMLQQFSPLQVASAEPKGFFVSVNVSARQFTDPSFIDHLESVRKSVGVPPRMIKLELTERIMAEGTQALETINECRKLGYLLAIDDFGTGFSSLQYLAQMPLTDMKIDHSFVSRMLSDEKSVSVVKSIINLAKNLNMNLIAEGIENVEQLRLLQSLGVPCAQGFFFAKALPLVEFLKLPRCSALDQAEVKQAA